MTSKKLRNYLVDLERLTGEFEREKARGELYYLVGLLDTYVEVFGAKQAIDLLKDYLIYSHSKQPDLEILIFQEIILNYINNY